MPKDGLGQAFFYFNKTNNVSKSVLAPLSGEYECGAGGYACIDPAAECVNDDDVTFQIASSCVADMIGDAYCDEPNNVEECGECADVAAVVSGVDVHDEVAVVTALYVVHRIVSVFRPGGRGTEDRGPFLSVSR